MKLFLPINAFENAVEIRCENASLFLLLLLLPFRCARFKRRRPRSILSKREHVVMGDERDSLSSWDVIVNNDDICFKHILPRLNRTDVRILVWSEYGDEKVD